MVIKNYKVILIAFLLGITIFSIFKYVSSLKALNTLKQMEAQMVALENEKQNLSQVLEKERQRLTQENSKIQAELKANEEKLAKLDAQLLQTQGTIEELNSMLSALKAENANLIEEKNSLGTQLTQVIEENEVFKARLSSISELKRAIRELKGQMRKVAREVKKRVRTKKALEGNRGFLIKNGKSTYSTKVKIEVKPISPEE